MHASAGRRSGDAGVGAGRPCCAEDVRQDLQRQENDLLVEIVQCPPGPVVARPHRRACPRAVAHARPAGRDDAPLQDGRDRRARSRHSGGGGDHPRSDDRPGALGRERPGKAIDCEHHEGHDGGGLPRRSAGPLADCDGRTRRHLRGVDDVLPRERTHHSRQSVAPHAHRVGQRGRARPRAPVARRDRDVRRADEFKGDRARSREHLVHRPLRTESGKHFVGLRSLAAHHLCRDRRADRADHAAG